MRMDESFKIPCRTKLSSEAAKNFMVESDDEYYHRASYSLYGILDNLPVAVPRQRGGSQAPSYEHSFHVGYKVSYYINQQKFLACLLHR
ncbi:hypothetical protein BHE74_00014691 [Ensete ventricosum]|nr:hypothetical protein BHE74_00014691 [Ensete ventricosum]